MLARRYEFYVRAARAISLFSSCYSNIKFISSRHRVISSIYSLQFKYMKFHIFNCILHLLRVYYELSKSLAPSWLDGSVSRAMHRPGIALVMGSNPVQAWVFSGFKFQKCFSCVHNCDDESYQSSEKSVFDWLIRNDWQKLYGTTKCN